MQIIALPWRPRLADVLAFLCLLSGGFTMGRVGVDIPILNEPRFILLFAAAAAALAHLLVRRPWRPRSGWQLPLALLALGYMAMSALWAPAGARVDADLVDLAMLAGLIVVYDLLAREDFLRTVRSFVVLTFASSTVYFFVAAAGFGHDNTDRWAALGGGPNVFVRIMVLGAAAAAVLCSSRVYRWTLLAVPFFFLGAFLSGSRGGMLATVATVGLVVPPLLWTRWRSRGKRSDPGGPRPRVLSTRGLLRAGLGVIAVAVVAGLTLGPAVWHTLDNRFIGQTLQQRYSSDRFVLFTSSWDLFLSSPWHGVGLDGFYVLAGQDLGELYPHNIVLSFAAEGGVIGLVLLVLAVVSSVSGARRRGALCAEHWFVIAAIVFVFMASQFSGSYYDARSFWVLLVVWGWRVPAGPSSRTSPAHRSEVAPRLGVRRADHPQAQRSVAEVKSSPRSPV